MCIHLKFPLFCKMLSSRFFFKTTIEASHKIFGKNLPEEQYVEFHQPNQTQLDCSSFLFFHQNTRVLPSIINVVSAVRPSLARTLPCLKNVAVGHNSKDSTLLKNGLSGPYCKDISIPNKGSVQPMYQTHTPLSRKIASGPKNKETSLPNKCSVCP